MKESEIEHIVASDAFKKKSEIQNPDIRVTFWAGELDKKFSNFYEAIEKIVLSENVPIDIRIQYETSKNVLLYSFYAYRMSTVAKSYAYSVFEKSLTERIRFESKLNGNIPEVKGLKRKLQIALEFGWVEKHDFFFNQDNAIKRDQELIDFVYNHFIKKRNELSHEPKSLDILWNVPEELALLGRLINKTWDN